MLMIEGMLLILVLAAIILGMIIFGLLDLVDPLTGGEHIDEGPCDEPERRSDKREL